MSKADSMDDVLASLESATALSADIVAAKNGSDAARERLAEPRTLRMKFPGSKQRAMGHALVIIEDLQLLGIEASREYEQQVLPPKDGLGAIHRIDIHVAGGASHE